MIERIPNGIRWLVVLPVSIGAGFLAASLFSLGARGVFTYPAALLSGGAYTLAALLTASRIAPSRPLIVVAVLGMLVIGDLTFVHLVLSPEVLDAASGSGLNVLLDLLRADDYRDVRHGGAVKIVGALAGLVLAWRITSTSADRATVP